MNKEKFEIIIETNKKLSITELTEIKYNLFGRLQGYQTECPTSLVDANMELKYVNIKKERKEKLQKINQCQNILGNH